MIPHHLRELISLSGALPGNRGGKMISGESHSQGL